MENTEKKKNRPKRIVKNRRTARAPRRTIQLNYFIIMNLFIGDVVVVNFFYYWSIGIRVYPCDMDHVALVFQFCGI